MTPGPNYIVKVKLAKFAQKGLGGPALSVAVTFNAANVKNQMHNGIMHRVCQGADRTF